MSLFWFRLSFSVWTSCLHYVTSTGLSPLSHVSTIQGCQHLVKKKRFCQQLVIRTWSFDHNKSQMMQSFRQLPSLKKICRCQNIIGRRSSRTWFYHKLAAVNKWHLKYYISYNTSVWVSSHTAFWWGMVILHVSIKWYIIITICFVTMPW